MRTMRLGMTVLFALAVMSVPAWAFHSGGVAECVGCHSMHTPDPAGTALLTGPDKSSTCLDNCHGQSGASSYHIATPDADMPAGTPPGNLTPGGDFGWIKKTYTWSPPWGGSETEEGDTHGHNIIASGFGYAVDGTNGTAPGGTFPSTALECSACHDPHGSYRRLEDGTIAPTGAPIIGSGSYNNSPLPGAGEAVGVYRLLYGNGATIDGVTFGGNPAAVAPSTYNRSENATQTRVAYGYGTTGGYTSWSAWCGTCHVDFHSTGQYVHPTQETISSDEIDNYNFYVKSGDMTGGPTTSYLSLVPFADGTTDFATLAAKALNNDTDLSGPGGTSRLVCMSCHRAHASGFEYALRWNPESEFLTYAGQWPGTDNGAPVQFARGRTEAEMQKAYYDRDASVFATYQRSLCNKCHAKD